MEWMARVNWADIIAIIVVLRSTYVGSQRGFFGELFYIFGIFLTIIFSLHFYAIVSNFLNTYLFIPLNVSNLISFVIITSTIYLCFRFIYGFLQKIIKIEVFPAINKIGGPMVGFCRGFVTATAFFLLMLLIPVSYITESARANSLLGPFFVKTGTVLYKKSLNLIRIVEPKDLAELLSGAEPLRFRMFRLKRRDGVDEILQ